jgi:hypothetical protein
VEVAQGLEAFFATHAADDIEVEDDGVVGTSDVKVALVERNGIGAVFDDVEGVVQAGEHAGGEITDFVVVIHE